MILNILLLLLCMYLAYAVYLAIGLLQGGSLADTALVGAIFLAPPLILIRKILREQRKS